MKFHLYEVVGKEETTDAEKITDAEKHSLIEVIEWITGLEELKEREFLVNEKPVFMEECVSAKIAKNAKEKTQGYFMDFTMRRFSAGPGYSKKGETTKDFDNFADPPEGEEEQALEDGFGEQTAALYVPESGHMIIQFNFAGVRAGNIAKYLIRCSNAFKQPVSFSLVPCLDPDAMKRFKNWGSYNMLGVEVSTKTTMDESRRLGGDLVGDFASREQRDLGAERIEMTFRAPRGVSLDRESVLSKVAAWVSGGKGHVTKLKAGGKPDEDSKAEVLDLIECRRVQEVEGAKLTSKKRRYPFETRKQALESVYKEWRHLMFLGA